MKQLLLAILLGLAFTSCQKDSNSIGPDFDEIGADRAEISVQVIVEDINADINGCVNGSNDSNIDEAVVSLFYLDEESPLSVGALLVGQTDRNGCTKFKDLPLGNYRVEVVSKLGEEQQDVLTSPGKLTKVFIRL